MLLSRIFDTGYAGDTVIDEHFKYRLINEDVQFEFSGKKLERDVCPCNTQVSLGVSDGFFVEFSG